MRNERTIFQLWINIRVYRFTILKIYHSIKIFNRNEFKYGNKLREIKKKFGENLWIRVFFFALDVNALRLRICRN